MNGQALHVKHLQPVPAKEIVQRGDGEVAQVLVVDRVELDALDQLPHVGNLDDNDAIVFEHNAHARDDAVEVRDVREHVVGVYHVGAPALLPELRRQPLPEEGADCGHAAVQLCHGSDVRSRVDAKHRNAMGGVELEQVAVVAADFDHQAVPAQAVRGHHKFNILASVLHDRIRER